MKTSEPKYINVLGLGHVKSKYARAAIFLFLVAFGATPLVEGHLRHIRANVKKELLQDQSFRNMFGANPKFDDAKTSYNYPYFGKKKWFRFVVIRGSERYFVKVNIKGFQHLSTYDIYDSKGNLIQKHAAYPANN